MTTDRRRPVDFASQAQLLLCDVAAGGPSSRELGPERVLAMADVYAKLAIAEAILDR